jgi:hypothetical protein
MPKNLTYEFVKNEFEKAGCKLLEKNYIGSKIKMKYMCNCGNISITTWAVFKKGHRCKKCGAKKTATIRKHDFEFIKKEFEKTGCTLLETKYINNHTKMKYQCSCGNISYSMFSLGQRCRKCASKKLKDKKTLTYEFVKKEFKKEDCELLEKEYIGAHTKMKYICSCGNQSIITWTVFQQGHRCRKCGNKKVSKKLKLTHEFIKNYFKSQNCELLEAKYINSITKMKYKCNCGNISFISFSNFRSGRRCNHCKQSKGEKEVQKFLENNNINYIEQKRFEECRDIYPLPFDFYIPNKNMCIEYDGEFHFRLAKFSSMTDEMALIKFTGQQKRDEIKNEYCKNNNIELLRIPYWEFKNIENIIKTNIL